VSEFGGAVLAAARTGARTRLRRAWFLASSLVVHFAAVGVLAFARPRAEPAAPPPPEPVLLRFSPPRPPARPPAPRPVKPPPRPRPVVQPAPVVQPPPVEPPPPEPPPPEPEVVEEPLGDTDTEGEAPPAPAGVAGVSGDAIHELREVARPPSVIEQVVPEYPRAARFERIVGLVLLRVVVGMDGRVEPGRTIVVRSVPELDAAAIAAIGKWRFSPALGHLGRPVRVVIEVPFQFSLR
jgi:periplasmic protein TonB